MMKKIRIAMIAANLELNGISSVIMNYCRNLDKKKFEITIIAGDIINDEFTKECNDLNISIIKLHSKRTSKIKYYFDLYNNIKKNSFDIFHVHGNSSIMAFDLFIARLKGIKIRIAHSHNTKCDNKMLHKLLNPMFKKLYTHAFACGDAAGNWLFGENNFYVINNGINIEKFLFDEKVRKSIRKELNVKENEILIGHIGRINYQKNQQLLLEAFEKMCENNNNNIKLLFVGTGPMFNELRKNICESKYKKNIILYGESNEPEKFYMAMDLFAFPSRYEGLPVTLIEAQVSGLRCFISNKITDEVILTPLVRKISIDSKDAWVDVLSDNINIDNKIKNRTMDVRKFKKFNIKENALMLEKYYKNFIEEVLHVNV